MSLESVSLSGLVLMFVLGLRHGLDPDHIACIDGLTWRALNQGARVHAPWVGTLFALGHGMVVTAIAVGVSSMTHAITVPEAWVQVFGWVPTVLLLLVGAANIGLLRRRGSAYAPAGWKLRLIPRRLREHSSPWAVVLIGVLFATVFDTATQASAWGYVAGDKGGGMLAALAAGLSFTAGMVITDTLDGRLICRVSLDRHDPSAGVRFRRGLGWLIVVMSFGVAAYNIGKAALPAIELDDLAFSLSGFCLVAVMLVIACTQHHRRRHVL